MNGRFFACVMVGVIGLASVASGAEVASVEATSARANFFGTLPAQPVLEVRGFSSCLAAAAPGRSLSLPEMSRLHELGTTDGLLPFLAVYPGVRPSKTASWLQDFAHWKWQTRLESAEERVANWLRDSEGTVSPRDFFDQALEACAESSDALVQDSARNSNDLLCAAMLGHNLFRTLGRHPRAVYLDRRFDREVDLNPRWFTEDRERWLGEIEGIRARLLPLRPDGWEKFGEWYHFFGILAFSLRELAVNGSLEAVESAVRWNRRLNPILAGGFEEPEKARLDLDSVEVAGQLFWLVATGEADALARSARLKKACAASGAYRVEPRAWFLSLSRP